jgi:uroporphyrinogen-III decarboxylase
MVFYAVFFTVIAVVVAGFTYRQTTPGVSSMWLTPQEAKQLLDKTTDVVIIDL